MRKTCVALLLLSAPVLRADGLSDLRTSLAKLTAKDGVQVAISLETSSRSDEDEPPDIGRASFEAEVGAHGLQLTYSRDLVARAQQEARAAANDPERPTPTRTATRQIDPVDLMELLDVASSLTRRLDNAKLAADQRISAGRAVRQLKIALQPKLSKSDAKRIKEFELNLTVNVDAENVPVSAELRQHVKAKFLLISFSQDQQESWAFARNGDRLIAVRHQSRSTGSGMGQKFENSRTMLLAVK